MVVEQAWGRSVWICGKGEQTREDGGVGSQHPPSAAAGAPEHLDWGPRNQESRFQATRGGGAQQ